MGPQEILHYFWFWGEATVPCWLLSGCVSVFLLGPILVPSLQRASNVVYYPISRGMWWDGEMWWYGLWWDGKAFGGKGENREGKGVGEWGGQVRGVRAMSQHVLEFHTQRWNGVFSVSAENGIALWQHVR